MKILFAVVIIIHAVAHLVGFVVPWKIAKLDEMPYKTTVFGGKYNVGDKWIRVIGLFWLAASILFFVAVAGIFLELHWWKSLVVGASVFSFLLSIIGLPDSRIGIWFNVLLILFLIIGHKYDWFTF
jgi:hypothetical protein